MGLDDLTLKLVCDLFLILRVLKQSEDQVLHSDGRGLRASEEECEALVDDPSVVVLEELV